MEGLQRFRFKVSGPRRTEGRPDPYDTDTQLSGPLGEGHAVWLIPHNLPNPLAAPGP